MNVREVILEAGDWDFDENRKAHERQWQEEGYRVSHIENAEPDRHRYRIILEPIREKG